MRPLLGLFGLCALFSAACTRPLAINSDCASHGSLDSCSADPACVLETCPSCTDVPSFAGCYGRNEPHGVLCATPSCSPRCASLGQAACSARRDCVVDTCPSCGEPAPLYVGCRSVGDPPTPCPGSGCPPLLIPCDSLTTEQACDASGDCHSVFTECRNCACATPGGCLSFDHCSDGKADCAGPAVCDQKAPLCDAPYTVGYANGCYEGCVLTTQCR